MARSLTRATPWTSSTSFALRSRRVSCRGSVEGVVCLGTGWLVLPCLVDDEVNAGLFDPQQGKPDVRRHAGAGGVLEEADDLDAHEDAVGGEVRRFARAFETVDDEVVGLDGEVPEVEFDGAELNLAAGGVLKHADDFLADAVLEVRGGGVPGEPAEEDEDEQDERPGEPGRPRKIFAGGCGASELVCQWSGCGSLMAPPRRAASCGRSPGLSVAGASRRAGR